jgi:hypothetical protein
MAIGEFVDYSELGSGGYEFQRANGVPFVAMGTEARRLAQMLDAQKQYAPQPTAMNGGREDPNALMSVPDVAAPTPGVSAAPQAPVVDLDQVAAQEAAKSPVPLYGTKGGGVMEKDPTTGQMYVRTPGSAGVSRQQLAAKSTQGVALPSGASQVTEGGFAPSDDYLNSMSDANIDKKLALQRLDDAQAQRAEAEQQFNANRVAEQSAGVEAERERQTKIAQGVDRDLLTLQQATSELKSTKVDPNRMFRGAGGTLRQIGMAIADAMGAFGAAINKTQNFAHGVIQASIERDIAEQEAELAQKGRNHNNALSAWIRSTGSLDQAKSGLRIQQLELAKSKADEIASMNKSQEVQANHAMVTASLDEDLAKNVEAYRQAALGKHTQQVSAQYAYPHAGSAGGRRLATQEEVKGDIAVQEGIAGVAHTQATTAKTVADAAKAKNPALGEAAQKTKAALATIDVLGSRLSKKDASKSAFSAEHQPLPLKAVRGAANALAGEGAWLPGNDAERAEGQEFDQIKNDLMAQTSVINGQGAQSDPEAARADRAMISGARTWGELQKAQNYLREKAFAAASAYGADAGSPKPVTSDLSKFGGRAEE